MTTESTNPTGPPRNNVSVRIDRLVLDGVPLTGAEAAQLRGALQRELGRLLARGGLGGGHPVGAAVPAVVAPPIQVPVPLRPAELGRRIARSVHESLARPL